MRPVKSLSTELPLGGSLVLLTSQYPPARPEYRQTPIVYAGLGLAEEALYLGNFRLTESRKHIKPG